MAVTNVAKTDTFDGWRVKTNTIASELGDNTLLVANSTLNSENAVDAVLETLAKVETEVGNINGLTTTALNLVGGINEHDVEIGVISTLTTAAKNNLVSSINELDSELGVLSGLTTTVKSTIVGSINEVVQRETDRYNNTLKLDLTDATVGGSNASEQAILSDISMPAGRTMTLSGTLDISSGQLIVGGAGGALNIQTTFLILGDAEAATASNGGVVVNRGEEGSTARDDVRVYWDETVKDWKLKKFADDNTTVISPHIIDSYNMKDVVVGGTQNGIAVTYDSVNNRANFDVNDFTITLSGDATGSATVTNLSNVNIPVTIQPNSIALGVDTTGAYVQSVTLSASNPGISLTQSSAGAESNAITALQVDSTVIRTTGTQSLAGVKTFADKPVFSTGFTSNGASTISTGGLVTYGNSSFENNLEVKGNFTVSGTVTTVNTETVTINDNIIVLNNNSAATPTENAGIEIERGSSTNTSLLWDETEDSWKFYNGSVQYDLVGKVNAGAAITVAKSTNKAEWTVNHADTSSTSSINVNNSANTFVQDIKVSVDTYGHVTELSSTSTEVSIGRGELTITAGGAITLGNISGSNTFNADQFTNNNITVNHADTSTQVSVNNAGYTYIQDIILDDYGHLTGITSSTWSATLANITDSTEDIQDIVGGMFSGIGNPDEFGISITYDDTTGKIKADVGDFNITLTGFVSGTGTVNNLGNVSITTSLNSSINTELSNAIKALLPKLYNSAGSQVFPT